MMGFPPCPACGASALVSTTYPKGITWYPDGEGYYLPNGDLFTANALMEAGELACRECDWAGRLVDPEGGSALREGSQP